MLAANRTNFQDPHVKCVSGQYTSTTLALYMISDVLPDDEPYWVETCSSNKEGLVC